MAVIGIGEVVVDSRRHVRLLQGPPFFCVVVMI